MKKILLLTAGVGALVAIGGGFAGIQPLIRIGGGAMLISLILLPWLREDVPSSDSHGPRRGSNG